MNQDRKLVTLFFNPFVYIAGVEALLIGMAVILLAGYVGSLSHTHFDGVLDMHTGAHAHLAVFLLEGVADWLCLGLVLLVMGRIVSKTSFRTIDILGTQALARWPTILTSLLTLAPAFQRFGRFLVEHLIKRGDMTGFDISDAVVFMVVVLLSLLLLCWTVALMYKSYSVSCNMKGEKAIGTFIAGLILAEIVSKLAVYWLITSI
jgi:hypothetical protein